MSTFPLQQPRHLRASPLVEDCSGCFVFKLFPDRSHCKEGPPVTGRLIKLRSYWMSQKSGKGDALRKETALLHTFVTGKKYGVWRDVYGLPPLCKDFVSNDRDRIAAVYPASLWRILRHRASMIFARIVLIATTVSTDLRPAQVFDTPV